MDKIAINESVLNSLSNSTLNKLTNFEIYNEAILKTNLIKITGYFVDGDINSLFVFYNKLGNEHKILTNEFQQKFKISNEALYGIKTEIKEELISIYQMDKSLNKDVETYKQIEVSLINRVEMYFQSKINYEEQLIETYTILQCVIFDLLGDSNLNNMYILKG